MLLERVVKGSDLVIAAALSVFWPFEPAAFVHDNLAVLCNFNDITVAATIGDGVKGSPCCVVAATFLSVAERGSAADCRRFAAFCDRYHSAIATKRFIDLIDKGFWAGRATRLVHSKLDNATEFRLGPAFACFADRLNCGRSVGKTALLRADVIGAAGGAGAAASCVRKGKEISTADKHRLAAGSDIRVIVYRDAVATGSVSADDLTATARLAGTRFSNDTTAAIFGGGAAEVEHAGEKAEQHRGGGGPMDKLHHRNSGVRGC